MDLIQYLEDKVTIRKMFLDRISERDYIKQTEEFYIPSACHPISIIYDVQSLPGIQNFPIIIRSKPVPVKINTWPPIHLRNSILDHLIKNTVEYPTVVKTKATLFLLYYYWFLNSKTTDADTIITNVITDIENIISSMIISTKPIWSPSTLEGLRTLLWGEKLREATNNIDLRNYR